MFNLLKRSKAALLALADNPRCTLKDEIKHTINSRAYWNNVDEVVEILEPIHAKVVAAQLNTATMDKVAAHWLDPTRKVKINKEVDVNNIQGKAKKKKDATQYRVLNAIKRSVDNAANRELIKSDYYSFRRKDSVFSADDDCWKLSMLNFWTNRQHAAPLLANYAIRLAKTRANTTTAERTFSTLRLLHTRLRNRLLPDQLDRLLTVYFNSRVRRQHANRLKGLTTDRKRKRGLDKASKAVTTRQQEQEFIDITEAYSELLLFLKDLDNVGNIIAQKNIQQMITDFIDLKQHEVAIKAMDAKGECEE
ncbi:unnamed protein product [Zymoseptoria tritici ST99CH_1E4]|uniref:HAT C-terminal dimerisation domain-containing protein n=1 Tax=Zymoseptoria tritici ST99CH_1E4 TaxID=1276532 RepID=A0A2H1GNH5_ZYMTR|nr:unnamed protein product [Zymoseptoria tritici ST99CH_1E4]